MFTRSFNLKILKENDYTGSGGRKSSLEQFSLLVGDGEKLNCGASIVISNPTEGRKLI